MELQFSIGVEFKNNYTQEQLKSGILSYNLFLFNA